MISFLIAGFVSLLAALCYAELASAVPAAGSSYTYAYTTIGEIFAWIIAWDLILEFALGAAVVARGWSGYLLGVFPFLPGAIFGEDSVVNLGAVFIVLVLGAVAIKGVKESAWVTNTLVIIKVSVCLFVILVGLFFIQKANLVPFVPPSQPVPRRRDHQHPDRPALAGADRDHPDRVRDGRRASSPPPSSSSRTAASRPWPTWARRPRTPSATCRSGCSAPSASAPCSTWVSAWSSPAWSSTPTSARAMPSPRCSARSGLGWAGVLIGLAAVAGLSSVILVDMVAMGRIGFALSRDGLLPPVFRQDPPDLEHPGADDRR